MTTQNNAAQPVLTDDEIRTIITDAHQSHGAFKTGYGLSLGRAIETALLSKLRAPVADERAAFEQAMRETYRMVDPLKPPPAGSYARGEHEGIIAALKTVRENFTHAALASAPVALSGVERQAVTGLIAVARAAFTFCDDALAQFEQLGEALDLLDELPDDQPGYSMGPSNRAEWALRRLLGGASAPVAGEAQPDDLNKRLLEATIRDLAAISEHLGLDPNEGGADPIIEAIDELRRERDDWVDAQYAAAGDASPQASSVAGEAAGEIVLFGSDLKEVSWRDGKMPPAGTKLYVAPQAPAGWRWTLHPAGLHPDVYAAAAARDSAEDVPPSQYDYQVLFDAIGKAVTSRADGSVSISVQAFRDALKSTPAPTAAEGGQASEALRIVFPAHLRKMWSGGEVQAWLDEHQGVTAPKASAKGSLERYRKWQAERGEAFGAGVNAAADLVKKMVDAYDTDHGSTDPETGTREYPGEGATWVCEMQELEESIRALSAQPGAIRNPLIAEPSGNPGELDCAALAARKEAL
ncbi:hypothetical protein L506_2294 [Bordetella bronchiseptica GA96-01]|uniref:hypothetical protein n=1 Tax=Bordetella bronchiseptica TaxID=518 RepID=UPI00045B8CDF|nr:hypothetical protein [Bordetella bronchiseptica]AZW31530.1 hypothetical protein CS343_15300 [Bordetella bronchiseptica]KCV40694.1 hypothetical protein L572_2321 [Bordetella bronchiseptica 345]KDC42216.1 hypothetical protein L506_2294 [Bordetella bronchiseptica GA96-01]